MQIKILILILAMLLIGCVGEAEKQENKIINSSASIELVNWGPIQFYKDKIKVFIEIENYGGMSVKDVHARITATEVDGGDSLLLVDRHLTEKLLKNQIHKETFYVNIETIKKDDYDIIAEIYSKNQKKIFDAESFIIQR